MRRLLLLAAALAASSANAGVVTSVAPERVSVTVYRNPDRSPAEGFNLRWLNGYALISEVRQVSLPAGATDLRFEGVAGGILPQSAIVTGLGEGVIEKNRDAYLLSAGSLIERSLGRRVHLRRTSRASGAVREQDVIVRSDADNGLVLQTADGFEALRCSGLAETVIYNGVPEGLSPRPTLSVRVRTPRPVSATVTLSYLASGFDWQANYVAELNESEDRLDLLAWLTVANGDETGFREAQAQAVAGRPNSERRRAPPVESPPLRLTCWPSETTSDIPEQVPPADAEEIVVTGSRMAAIAPAPPPPPPPPAPERGMEAEQESLGDLKLYRIPEPVTVAARSQKQVRFLERDQVPVRFVYRGSWTALNGRPQSATRVLIVENKPAARLGVPLPSGQLLLLGRRGEDKLLLGQGSTDDKAVGETVEIELGQAPGVQVQTETADGKRTLTVFNDQSRPRTLEIDLPDGATGNARRNGRPIWRVTVPPNQSRSRAI